MSEAYYQIKHYTLENPIDISILCNVNYSTIKEILLELQTYLGKINEVKLIDYEYVKIKEWKVEIEKWVPNKVVTIWGFGSSRQKLTVTEYSGCKTTENEIKDRIYGYIKINSMNYKFCIIQNKLGETDFSSKTPISAEFKKCINAGADECLFMALSEDMVYTTVKIIAKGTKNSIEFDVIRIVIEKQPKLLKTLQTTIPREVPYEVVDIIHGFMENTE